MKRILVTGGAGYIGMVCVKELIKQGYDVVVVDNLSKGKKELVDKKAEFFELDIKDNLDEAFKEIDAVIHFAAYKSVEESMQNPMKYADNITGTINLLDAMVKHKVGKIVFSSTASVYGSAKKTAIDETCPLNPTNFYGWTKLECEKIIEWYAKAYGINYVSLRYFNVVGDVLGHVDSDAQNVLPIMMGMLFGKRKSFTIFGSDYKTKDGTCVRDYIDVKDIVKAHILALGLNKDETINLGTSNGTTVKELVSLAEEVAGKKIRCKIGKRRIGDPAIVVASNEKAKRILGWKPEISLKESIKSMYKAYSKKYIN